jgi:hypothetical protein
VATPPAIWSTFPELWSNCRKLAPAVTRSALTKYRLFVGPFRVLFSSGFHFPPGPGRSSALNHALTMRRHHDDVITGGRAQLDRPRSDRTAFDVARRFMGFDRFMSQRLFVGLRLLARSAGAVRQSTWRFRDITI